ncbi:microsomal signal peptidase [Thamnocephalis sphaerospora]|uniref:Signal peptidase complex subunit 1 n=1 Tax=Thamnocephalis sphaerospora TaxID=78915 RepID=A0A4V1IX27_9FUNG|nr:microsomal signal peptidase [Thamnocephalis sphaerospora]|eukprot:RKP09599.1 microsomal signal peptidase [Thamnocephalis sphaerospora]
MLSTWMEGKIDFEGQKLTEDWSQQLIAFSTVASFVYGYWTESISSMLLVYAIGYAITILICTPAWPAYNKHPVTWLPAIEDENEDGSDDGDRAAKDD